MKMINVVKAFVFSVVLVLFATSCSNKNTDYVNVIPKDAKFVLAWDVESLARKGGINEKDIKDLIDTAFMEIREKNKDDKDDLESIALVERLAKNPMETGFSLGDKVYFFMTGGDNSQPVLLAEVDNARKVKDIFDTFHKKDACDKVVKKNGFYQTVIDKNTFVAFNEDVFIMHGMRSRYRFYDYESGDIDEKAHAKAQKEDKEAALKLLKQSKAESLISDRHFAQLVEEMNDFAFYLPMNAVKEFYKGYLNIIFPEGYDFDETNLIGDLNFMNGGVEFSYHIASDNSDVLNMIEKYSKAYPKMKNTFINLFPSETMGYMGFGLNGDAIYEYIKDNKDFKSIEEEIGKEEKLKRINLAKLIKSFDGDFVIGLTDFSNMFIPNITCYIEMKDDYIMNLVESYEDLILSEDKNFQKLGKGKYIYTDAKLPVYFGFEGRHAYFTTDKSISDNSFNIQINPLSNNPIMGNVKKTNIAALINMDALMRNPSIKMATAMGASNAEEKRYLELLTTISHVEAYSVDGKSAKFSVVMKNKDRNVLHILVHDLVVPFFHNEIEKGRSNRNYYEDDLYIQETSVEDAEVEESEHAIVVTGE